MTRLTKILITYTMALLLVVSMTAVFKNFEEPKIREVLGSSSTSTYEAENSAINIAPQATPNNYENTIVGYINNYRIENGLSGLECDLSLTYVAKLRSQDLLDRNYFSHYTPEGTNVADILQALGIEYNNIGENLGQASPARYGSPEAFMGLWKSSPPHNHNLLQTQFNKVGVGVTDNGDWIIVTTVFTN